MTAVAWRSPSRQDETYEGPWHSLFKKWNSTSLLMFVVSGYGRGTLSKKDEMKGRPSAFPFHKRRNIGEKTKGRPSALPLQERQNERKAVSTPLFEEKTICLLVLSCDTPF